jgi:hypothetical protein
MNNANRIFSRIYDSRCFGKGRRKSDQSGDIFSSRVFSVWLDNSGSGLHDGEQDRTMPGSWIFGEEFGL